MRCGAGRSAGGSQTPERRGRSPGRSAASSSAPRDRPPVLFGGAVGNDAHAAAQLRTFDDDGVDIRHLLTLDDIHTGLSAVWVDARSGDNRIMNSPGANGRMTADALAPVPVEDAGLLLIQNETPADGVRSAIERAHGAGVPAIWNPAPIDEASDPGLDPRQVAWVTPNEVECAVLLGRPGERIDAGGAPDAAAELLDLGYRGAILTLGPAGVLLAQPGAAPVRLPAPEVAAVDTTGAGDAFNAPSPPPCCHRRQPRSRRIRRPLRQRLRDPARHADLLRPLVDALGSNVRDRVAHWVRRRPRRPLRKTRREAATAFSGTGGQIGAALRPARCLAACGGSRRGRAAHPVCDDFPARRCYRSAVTVAATSRLGPPRRHAGSHAPLAAVAGARIGRGARRPRRSPRRRLGRLPAAERTRGNLRRRLRRAPRLRTRPVRGERHRLARSSASGDGRGTGRRGHRAGLHVRGDRRGGPVRGLRTCVRRHRSAHLVHRRRVCGGTGHRAHPGDRAGAPGDDDHGPRRDRVACREAWTSRARGLRPCPRCPMARTRRRLLGQRRFLQLPDLEADDRRRGRHRDHLRRDHPRPAASPGELWPPAPRRRGAGSGHRPQLPDDRPAGRNPRGPARQARPAARDPRAKRQPPARRDRGHRRAREPPHRRAGDDPGDLPVRLPLRPPGLRRPRPRHLRCRAWRPRACPPTGASTESLPVSELLRPDPARYPAWSEALARRPAAECPQAERLAYRESVWLPHQLLLGAAADVDDIVEAVLKVQRGAADLAGLASAEVEHLRQARSVR